MLRVAHGGGREVHVWTVDDPAEMAELLDMGADGILTDRPDLLRDLLRARDPRTACGRTLGRGAPSPPTRGQVLAWALWDWGSAAFNAVILTFVFSVYLTDAVGDDLPGGREREQLARRRRSGWPGWCSRCWPRCSASGPTRRAGAGCR